MKLVYAIVRNDNEDDVIAELTQNHFSITKLSTTGGFLKKGNTTLLIGTEDDQVDKVISIIKKNVESARRLPSMFPTCPVLPWLITAPCPRR